MNLVKIESTELDKVVVNSGLAIQEGEEIKQSYIPFIIALNEIHQQATKIDFNNPTLLDEEIAGKLRKATVKIRTGASDLKDERKRIFLLKGNLEQAAFNLISASCKLTEETLNNVEKAREIAEKKRKEERKLKRIQVLTSLEYDFTFVDILNMPDEQFDKLVLQCENERDAKIQAAIQIEKERLERLEAERVENERIRLENERLKKEREEKEKQLEIERKKQIEQQRIADEKLRKEREEKEKLQREIDAKKQAEIKAKREADEKAAKEQKERLLAEKKAANAPDKVKLQILIDDITIPMVDSPVLKSNEANDIYIQIAEKFDSFRNWSLKQIESL